MYQRIEPQCDSVDVSGPLRCHCLVQGNWSVGPLEGLKVVPMGPKLDSVRETILEEQVWPLLTL